jgi:hypothetical protein
VELVEEGLPRRDRRERESGRFSEGQPSWLVSHDPFVDSMEGCIRPWSIDGSRVVDLIAGDEQCRRVADLAHDSRGVEAQDPRRTLRIGPRPLLDVNGVHRDGVDLDEEVVRSEVR